MPRKRKSKEPETPLERGLRIFVTEPRLIALKVGDKCPKCQIGRLQAYGDKVEHIVFCEQCEFNNYDAVLHHKKYKNRSKA